MRYALALSVLVASLGAAAAAAGEVSHVATPTLRADVAEWSIVPSAGAVRAGRVRVVVHNLGASAHEVVLVRTRSFGERLRLQGVRADVRPLAASRLVPAGGTASFLVSLRPGSYLLLDNLPWHYWKGTAAAFSVR